MKTINVKIHYNSVFAWFLREGLTAFTVGNHIFVKESKLSKEDLNHELIHVCQYNRLGVVYFLWRYFVTEFRTPYMMKRFEMEAYTHQCDPLYISKFYPKYKIKI